jgi:hypothetical protein
MALRYTIQTITSVPVYTDAAGVAGTEVTSYANTIKDITSFDYDAAKQGITFVKGEGSGFVPREQVLFVLPYDDGS